MLTSLYGGGAERVVCRLLAGLDRRVFEPTLVLMNRTGEYLQDVPADVPVVDLQKGGRWDVFRMLWSLRRRLRRARPDVVFSLLDYPNILTVLASLGWRRPYRVIISEHNFHRRYLPETRLPGIRRWLMSLTYRRADTTVVVSQGLAQSLIDDFGVEGGRIEVIHNPLELGVIQTRSREPVTHPFLAPSRPNGFVIVAAGRLTKQKNFALAIRALADLRCRRPACLIILGQGELEVELKALADELGVRDAVDFVGFQQNPFAWMRQADAFVLSSSWEGFGIVVAEAQACGVPVVSTDCPAGPSEIIEDRVSGILVPVDDPQAMSRALDELATQPALREALVRRALERGQRFDLDHVVGRYAQLFRESVGLQRQSANSLQQGGSDPSRTTDIRPGSDPVARSGDSRATRLSTEDGP